MSLEKFFRIVSYLTVLCGFLSLWISGTFGTLITAGFIAAFFAAWFIEDSRFQIGEKLGTALIVLALPVFYGLWNSDLLSASGGDTWIAGLLARMILCLSAIKLLQRKSDRDWIFLYLMSFFEVLLAAGLSISATYMASFVFYVLAMACSIVAFEIRRTSRAVEHRLDGSVADRRNEISDSRLVFGARRIPVAAVALLAFILFLAIPLFFALPRVGGAGFGGDQRGMATTGFSDRVTLGRFGRIAEDDRVVMRVKLEGAAAGMNDLYFRGVALDTFDNQAWSRLRVEPKVPFPRGSNDTITLGMPRDRGMLVQQTVYLEPLDTPVLFVLPRAISLQGSFVAVNLDTYGAISHTRAAERISYKAVSDRSRPPVDDLRADDRPYSMESQAYRSLPNGLDPRIAELAREVTSKDTNRFDKALTLEKFLQNNFGYTLEQRAGGKQPLADFLFNVKEGHCEYFASAMAIMLRTQGIATRIVNGFHGGDLNDASGLTVIRQRHAHAWVEVYFPGLDAWVTFDPTPFAGQPGGNPATGIGAVFGKYIEAIEAIWIQYFVAYDDQGQRSLGRSVRDEFQSIQSGWSRYLGLTADIANEWLAEVRGDKGLQASILAIVYAAAGLIAILAAMVTVVWLIRRCIRSRIWRRLTDRFRSRREDAEVAFYQRLLAILSAKGFTREAFQTPLEFAHAVGHPEAILITQRYQEVRFGKRPLTCEQDAELRQMLKRLQES